MDSVAKLEETEIMEILVPTREAFTPLLTSKLPIISKTPKKTFKYGTTDRHQVDVYYPPEGTSNAPILFFIYGGGFLMGTRQAIPGLVFDNIGSFFAQRGILTAVADYQLAPASTYPEPVEDIRDAVKFVLSSPAVDVAGHGADKTSVYLAGHSAGAAHASTFFLNESILKGIDRKTFKGAILISGAYGNVPPPLSSYYGVDEDHTHKTPFGLLRGHPAEKAKQLLPPKVFLLHSERDPVPFIMWTQELRNDLKERGVAVQEHIMVGHNHISPEVCLSSGEGEEWGEEVAKFVKA